MLYLAIHNFNMPTKLFMTIPKSQTILLQNIFDLYKCINFSSMYDGNILDLLDARNRLKISPSLAVNNNVSKKMELVFNGHIEFVIKLNLGF